MAWSAMGKFICAFLVLYLGIICKSADGQVFSFFGARNDDETLCDIQETTTVSTWGRWASNVSTSCRNEIKIKPQFTSIFGQIPITICGPCFNKSYDASCTFQDGNREISVQAEINDQRKTPVAICIVPILYTQGRIRVDLNLQYGYSRENYSGFIYARGFKTNVDVNISKVSDNEIRLNLTWQKGAMPQNRSLELALMEYDPRANQWNEGEILESGISNTGHTELVMPMPRTNFFSVFTLRQQTRNNTTIQNRTKRSFQSIPLAGPAIDFLIRVTGANTTFWVDKKVYDGEYCRDWSQSDSGLPKDVLNCPPTMAQAEADQRFVKAPTSQAQSIGGNDPMNCRCPSEDGQNSQNSQNSMVTFSQRCPSPSGASQNCAYKKSDGQLMIGGTYPDRYSPNNPTGLYQHIANDVLVRSSCCGVANANQDSCSNYETKRPPDCCQTYVPPTWARGYGDPHITTFDGFYYTFNGLGEFWVIKGQGETDFQLQGRTGQWSMASVFTAFAIRQNGETIQVQLGPGNGIDVLHNGKPIRFDQNETTIITSQVTVTCLTDPSQVIVSSNSGFTAIFMRYGDFFTVWAVTGEENRGKPRGLLGDFDGNQENDLSPPDGRLLQLNTSLESIHYDFGMKWMVQKNESFFTYDQGKSYESVKNESFRPYFPPKNLQQGMPADVIQMCAGEYSCLYDYAITGNKDLAKQTHMDSKKFNESKQTLSTVVPMCPRVPSPRNGYMNVTNFMVGQQVKFGCLDGYRLNGADQLQCTDRQQWSGYPPVCEGKNGGVKTAAWSRCGIFGIFTFFFVRSILEHLNI